MSAKDEVRIGQFFQALSVKDWANLKPTQQTSLVALILSAGVTGVLYHFFGSNASYYSVIGSTALVLGLDRLTRYSFENKMEHHMDRMDLKKRDLEYIGDAEAGISWFCKHAIGATAITNTVFRDRRGDAAYATDNLDRFFTTVKALLITGTRWTDVIYSDQIDEARLVRSKLSNDEAKNYRVEQVKDLPATVPLMQAIIIRHGRNQESPLSIMYGWGYVNAVDSHVFVSTDQTVCNYFYHYFQGLPRKEVDLGPPHPASLPTAPGPLSPSPP